MFDEDQDWRSVSDELGGTKDVTTDEPVFNEPPIPKRLHQVARRHAGWRLHNALYAKRVMRSMSQAVLAGKVGVSRQTISAIENNHHEPVLSLGLAIAEALQVNVEEVFKLRRPEFSGYEKRKR